MPSFRQQKNRTFSVQIKCLDAELEFDLDKKSLGRDLLELVCRTLGIRETWYFGLQYKDTKEIVAWLKMDKLVREHSVERQTKLSLLFLVKFYPEEVAEELIQEITQHLFFLQVNRAILAMDIYCPPEASVLLASYAVQVKFGDYDENTYKPGMLATENLLPQRVIDQYQMTLEMWEDRIKVWYADHRGMTRDEAEMEYLKIAQDLDMYGVNYFLIHNKKDTTLWLGVTALGLNIYERENKLQPKMTFTWSEIRDISFEDKKFIIKVVDKQSPNFVFFSKKTRINKVILDLCVGNHSLFMRRRMPDTIEVQQMKTSAKEDKQRRIVQRNRLAHEKQLREECEKQKSILEQRLAQAHEEIRLANEALKRSEETAELLAEKSRIAEEEAMLLGKKATDAEQEIARIRLSAMRTEEEKASLERKTHEAELLTVRLVEESERRVAEANRLKDELMKARLAEKQAKEKLLDFISHVPPPSANSNSNSNLAVATSTVPLAPLSPISSIYGTNNNNNNTVNGNQSQILPTQISVTNLVQQDDEQSLLSTQSNCDVEQLSLAIEKERIEYLKKSKHLLSKLENLRSEIEVLKVDEKWTDFDNLYESQIKLGENKYSTLHKVKSGSAKQRVAFFEEL